MYKPLFFTVFSLIMLLNISCRESSLDIEKLTASEFHEKYYSLLSESDGVAVIDGRTPAMFASGHLLNAIQIDAYSDEAVFMLDDYIHCDTLVLYCTTFRRVEALIKMLEQKEYGGKVIFITDGIRAWSARGFPLVKEVTPSE